MWIKVECSFFEDPRVAEIGIKAAWVYLQGVAYCMEKLTDGFIPYSVARRFAGLATRTTLVKAGLWTAGGKGYLVTGYLTSQVSRQEIEKQREKTRQRVKAFRDKQPKM